MVHFVGGRTRGVQVKLRDPLRRRAIPECLRGVITTRRYTNPRLPLPYLYQAYLYETGEPRRHTAVLAFTHLYAYDLDL